MSVELKDTRRAVLITWGDHVKGDTVDIRCTNPDAPDDPSWRKADNSDHSATLSFPADYHGTTDVVVSGDEGTTDTGSITV